MCDKTKVGLQHILTQTVNTQDNTSFETTESENHVHDHQQSMISNTSSAEEEQGLESGVNVNTEDETRTQNQIETKPDSSIETGNVQRYLIKERRPSNRLRDYFRLSAENTFEPQTYEEAIG